MKTLSILAKPAIIIAAFCLLLISGESFGGFYLLYILLGLSHIALHSILALIGIALLSVSSYRFKQQYQFIVEPIINIVGLSLLLLSLGVFFNLRGSEYNYSTFYQPIPLSLLVLFGFLSLNFLFINVSQFYLKRST